MLWTWHEATVTAVENLTHNTRRFCLSVNETSNFEYCAGQFVTFDLPISEKRLQRWRSYSIASAADGSNNFELCIVQLEGGAATRYFFEDVKIGTILKFKGADGSFVLPETLETDICMICTGTGIAPFRAMLQHILKNNIPHKNLHLIFGTRRSTDILYLEEWRELEKKHPEFKFSVALSREENPDFSSGYVHSIYLENIKNYKNKNDVGKNTTQYFICGWKAMIDEARTHLTGAGFDASQISYELYG